MTLQRTFLGLLALAFAGVALAGIGCSRRPDPQSDASGTASEKHYPLLGEVLAVNTPEKTLRVRHEAIEGLMPAMAMEFAVTQGDLGVARVGMRIRADLVIDAKGDMRLEKLWPADPADVAVIQAAARKLSEDTTIRGNGAYREVGETAPEFALYDQEGRVVASSRFKGKQVVVNFIYTRCQVTRMCPAAVARFQQLQRSARDAGVKDLELVSISLDPEYDTPGVLKDYARLRAIDTSNYAFLTGPDTAVRSLLAQFGVLVENRDSLINHTEATLLIGRDGKIVHRVDGSTWEVQDFLERIKRGAG